MRPLLAGLAASIGLLAAYFSILTATNSFQHALDQLADLWYLMVPLIAGFGVQIGLFAHIRQLSRASAKTAAASASVSGGSMIACCAHHVTDVLPLVGLSALAAVTVRYQPLLLLIGVASNVVGILFMADMLKKRQAALWPFSLLAKYDIRMLMEGVIVITAAAAVPMLVFM